MTMVTIFLSNALSIVPELISLANPLSTEACAFFEPSASILLHSAIKTLGSLLNEYIQYISRRGAITTTYFIHISVRHPRLSKMKAHRVVIPQWTGHAFVAGELALALAIRIPVPAFLLDNLVYLNSAIRTGNAPIARFYRI